MNNCSSVEHCLLWPGLLIAAVDRQKRHKTVGERPVHLVLAGSCGIALG